ncbi:MAG: formate dehydrogenase accessory sulfurtransferase FdhD [Saprospiraceae bacterium]|nr:formate dehydrogenase accessory sulfurtransferase FdhD [Saprospiraceae bacterium]
MNKILPFPSMQAITESYIKRIHTDHPAEELQDQIITEAPLEILIGYTHAGARLRAPVAATMRTPGDDLNLVAGWLFAEGIIHGKDDLLNVRFTDNTDTVLAELHPSVVYDPEIHQRQFPISSACGWCGRYAGRGEQAQILPKNLTIPKELIYRLPEVLRSGQGLFSATGGAHAAALVDEQGQLVLRCEDVGRHNAMDKLIGAMLQQKKLPLHRHIVVFSGRFGYELAQKALVAGIQIACSIGAPSSAAIELAEAYGMTVCGFVRNEVYNIYSSPERLQ